MFITVLLAYFPQYFPEGMNDSSMLDRLAGAPSWLRDPYDINAKVSEADLAEWQKQGVTPDKEPILTEMLRTMLADRCHLVAHMAPGPPISSWSLQLGKHTPHLTESKPEETLPTGMKLRDGGVLVPRQPGERPNLDFHAATMADLARILSLYAGRPVQDHTGLTGHYDFVVDWIGYPNSKVTVAYHDPNDTDPLSRWNLDALDLHYTPVKIPADTLVIDHIEKPSEN